MKALHSIILPSLALNACTAADIHSTVPANPLPYHSTQPDGSTTPPLYFYGDGIDNYVADESGYVVVKDGGWLVYAQENVEPERTSVRGRRLDHATIVPSQHAVGSIDPSTVPGFTTVEQRKRHSRARRLQADTTPAPKRNRALTQTKFQSLILLLRFKDHASRTLPTLSHITQFYNRPDLSLIDNDIAPTGSIHEVFWENSYGLLDAQAKVVDWITLSETEAYYANGEYGFQKLSEAIHEALGQVFATDILSDLERIDGLGIMHSGFGAEYGGEDCHGQANTDRIWSHQAGNLGFVNPRFVNGTEGGIASLEVPQVYYVASALRNLCGSDITRVGIVAHEMGHQLGLPDLYDKTFEGNGAGFYDPMSKSWGWDGTGLYPPIFSAWSKTELGWVTPLEITGNGLYTLGSSANVPHVYIIRHGFADGEYLLIENRQPEGFDSQLKGGGLAIWKVDENANGLRGYKGQDSWPQNGNHYKVALLQADGNHDLEQGTNAGDATDLWHKWGEFSSIGPSNPGSTEIVEGDAYLVPNTDSYRDGNIIKSGIWLFNFTARGEYMSFSVRGFGNEVASPGYPSPSSDYVVELQTSANGSSASSPTTNSTSSPTPQPTVSPTTSSEPTVDPRKEFLYYPDWLEMGCKRKTLDEFSAWEKNRFDNVGDCCYKSMEWDYMKCVHKSILLIYGEINGAAPQMAMPQDLGN